MTPHPQMSRRGRGSRFASNFNQGQNGLKSDVLGGGDPLGGTVTNGFQENGEFPQRIVQYPSLRGSRISVRPSVSDPNVADRIWGDGENENNFGDSTAPQKRPSPTGSGEAQNGPNRSLALVANGAEILNGNSHPEK